MKITKSQIIEIANIIKTLKSDDFIDEGRLVSEFCAFLKRENPAFKETRFRDYIDGKCGPNGGKV